MNIVQYIACGRTAMIELVSALVAVRIVPENDCPQSRLRECRRTVPGSLALHIAPGSIRSIRSSRSRSSVAMSAIACSASMLRAFTLSARGRRSCAFSTERVRARVAGRTKHSSICNVFLMLSPAHAQPGCSVFGVRCLGFYFACTCRAFLVALYGHSVFFHAWVRCSVFGVRCFRDCTYPTSTNPRHCQK